MLAMLGLIFFVGAYCWLTGKERVKSSWHHDTVVYLGVPLEITAKIHDEPAYRGAGEVLSGLLDQYQARPVKERALALAGTGRPWCQISLKSVIVDGEGGTRQKRVCTRLECIEEGGSIGQYVPPDTCLTSEVAVKKFVKYAVNQQKK